VTKKILQDISVLQDAGVKDDNIIQETIFKSLPDERRQLFDIVEHIQIPTDGRYKSLTKRLHHSTDILKDGNFVYPFVERVFKCCDVNMIDTAIKQLEIMKEIAENRKEELESTNIQLIRQMAVSKLALK